MELPQGTKTAAFFAGALRGLAGGLLLGLVVGGIAAFAMHFAIVPMLMTAAPGFATWAQGLTFMGGVFSPIPLMALNGVLFGLSTAITNGFSKVGQVEGQFQNAVLENKLGQVAAREQQLEQGLQQVAGRGQQYEKALHTLATHGEQLEQKVSHHITAHAAAQQATPETPRHVKQILEEGPRVKVEKEAAKDHAHASHAAEVVADRLESAEQAIG